MSGRYAAFLSYSHRDSSWAARVHRYLEGYRSPKALVEAERCPARIGRVFRDREELPTSADLGRQIEDALEQSDALIVLCSPRSARSRWVNEEVASYKRLGRSNRILCLIIDGEPNAADPDQECFCPALKVRYDEDGAATGVLAEPVAADARAHADGRANALLKLVAGLLGVGFDDLRRREERRRQARVRRIAIASLLLALAMGGLAAFAWHQRGTARRAQADEARARGRAQREADENRRRLVRNLVETGERCLEDGDVGSALLWFLEAEDVTAAAGWAADARIHRLRAQLLRLTMPDLRAQLEEPVNRGVLSADGTRLIGAADPALGAFAPVLFDTATGRALARGPRHRDAWAGAGFAGDRLVTADWNGVQVWRATDGALLGTLARDSSLKSIAVHPQHPRLLTAEGALLREWDLETGKLVGTHTLPRDRRVVGARYRPDGRSIVVADDQLTIRAFASPVSKALGEARLAGADGVTWDRARLGQIRLVAQGHAGDEQVFRAWSVRDGKPAGASTGLEVAFGIRLGSPVPLGPLEHVAAATTDGRLLVTGGLHARASFVLAPRSRTAIDAWADDAGSRVAIRRGDGAVEVWAVASRERLAVREFDPATSRVHGFLEDEPVLRGEDGPAGVQADHAWFWNYETDELVRRKWASPWASRNGRSTAYYFARDGRLEIGDARSGKVHLNRRIRGVRARLGRNRRTVVVVSEDGIRSYRLADGAPVGPAIHVAERVETVRSTGELTAYCTGKGQLAVHATATGAKLWQREGVVGFSFGTAGRRIVLLDADHSLRIHDARDGRALSPLVRQEAELSGVELDGDRLIAWTFRTGEVQVWDAATGWSVCSVSGLRILDRVHRVGERLLYLLTTDPEGSLWDLETGQRVSPMGCHVLVCTRAGILVPVTAPAERPLLAVGDPRPGTLGPYARAVAGRKMDAKGALAPLSDEERAAEFRASR